MDFVYLIKEDKENDSEELRYSLRSLKNVPHDKVVIVGEKPEWVTNVTYIPVEQNKSKHENVAINLNTAVNSELVSDNFVLMNDDFFIMKQIPAIPPMNFGKLEDVIASYEARYPEGTDYIESMKHTQDILANRGLTNLLSYELHTPVILNKQNVRETREKIHEAGYQFRTIYGNLFPNDSSTYPDVKVFLEPRHNAPEFNRDPSTYLATQTFLSATGGAFKRGVAGDFVRNAFPEKSEYEV